MELTLDRVSVTVADVDADADGHGETVGETVGAARVAEKRGEPDDGTDGVAFVVRVGDADALPDTLSDTETVPLAHFELVGDDDNEPVSETDAVGRAADGDTLHVMVDDVDTDVDTHADGVALTQLVAVPPRTEALTLAVRGALTDGENDDDALPEIVAEPDTDALALALALTLGLPLGDLDAVELSTAVEDGLCEPLTVTLADGVIETERCAEPVLIVVHVGVNGVGGSDATGERVWKSDEGDAHGDGVTWAERETVDDAHADDERDPDDVTDGERDARTLALGEDDRRGDGLVDGEPDPVGEMDADGMALAVPRGENDLDGDLLLQTDTETVGDEDVDSDDVCVTDTLGLPEGVWDEVPQPERVCEPDALDESVGEPEGLWLSDGLGEEDEQREAEGEVLGHADDVCDAVGESVVVPQPEFVADGDALADCEGEMDGLLLAEGLRDDEEQPETVTVPQEDAELDGVDDVESVVEPQPESVDEGDALDVSVGEADGLPLLLGLVDDEAKTEAVSVPLEQPDDDGDDEDVCDVVTEPELVIDDDGDELPLVDDEIVPLPDTLLDTLGVPEGDPLGDKESVPQLDADEDGDTESVDVALTLNDGDALPLAESEIAPLLLALADRLGVPDGDSLGDDESVTQLDADGDAESESVEVALTLSNGDALPLTESENTPLLDALLDRLGVPVDDTLGDDVTVPQLDADADADAESVDKPLVLTDGDALPLVVGETAPLLDALADCVVDAEGLMLSEGLDDDEEQCDERGVLLEHAVGDGEAVVERSGEPDPELEDDDDKLGRGVGDIDTAELSEGLCDEEGVRESDGDALITLEVDGGALIEGDDEPQPDGVNDADALGEGVGDVEGAPLSDALCDGEGDTEADGEDVG